MSLGHKGPVKLCDLCGGSSEEEDPKTPGYYIMWVKCNADGSLRGATCGYCNNLARRFYRTFKKVDLVAKMRSNERFRAEYEDRLKVLKSSKSIRLSTAALQEAVATQTLKSSTKVRQTIALEGDLLYTPEAFQRTFNTTGEELGRSIEEIVIPGGRVLRGFRIRDEGQARGPEVGIYPIARAVDIARLA
eukprot:3516251-Alexandrium_andersonii.AAC.1